jgi:hypothetical protein
VLTALLTPAAVLLAVGGIVVGVRLDSDASQRHPPMPAIAPPVAGLDATSLSEARIMRTATRRLAGDLSAGARCGAPRFAACAMRALRRAVIGGRTTAMLLRGVSARVPAGVCRSYLFGLGAANDAASDQARWLILNLYGNRRRRHTAAQIALAARMLDQAWRAARADVCSPSRPPA